MPEKKADIIRRQIIDLKMIKAFMAGAKDQSNLNIVYVENIHLSPGETCSVEEKNMKKLLLDVLSNLPEPRLERLNMMAYDLALELHEYRKLEAAKFLGISKDRLYKRFNDKKELIEGWAES